MSGDRELLVVLRRLKQLKVRRRAARGPQWHRDVAELLRRLDEESARARAMVDSICALKSEHDSVDDLLEREGRLSAEQRHWLQSTPTLEEAHLHKEVAEWREGLVLLGACPGITRTGSRCRAPCLRGERHCVSHHPAADACCWGGPLDGQRLGGWVRWGLGGPPIGRRRAVFAVQYHGEWRSSSAPGEPSAGGAYWLTRTPPAWTWCWLWCRDGEGPEDVLLLWLEQ